jgi:AcrR family transcriptional regulator
MLRCIEKLSYARYEANMNQHSGTSLKKAAAVLPDPETEGSFGVVAKPPQQGRSRASLERMLDAAEALMVERGSDDFALTEVGRVGRVSIGSIYNRFASKEELLHAVHARALERMRVDQAKITVRARSRSTTPTGLVKALLDDIGEFLKVNAPIMRPMMLRAGSDSVVQKQGASAHDAMVDSVTAEMMTLSAHIRHSNPEAAVRAVIRIAYAAFARELGFGMTEMPDSPIEMSEVKKHVAAMGSAYLFCDLPSA